jgi:transcriptional regulator with XRE-family HTH domain
MSKAKTLGEVLREGRAAAGLSVRQLEAQSGVPKSTVSRLENDDSDAASPTMLVKLAQALELRASDLFMLAGIPIPGDLPSLPAMLRAEYKLPPEAIAEVQRNIEQVAAKYEKRTKTRNKGRRSSR